VEMHPYKRASRLGDLIREEVADIVQNRIKYKSFGFLTITGAKVSDDLRNAVVYVSVLELEQRDRTIRKLNATASVVRSELGRRLKIKYIPRLKFMADESVEYGMKIDRILNELKQERMDEGEDEEDIY
jgi:ribosome-binding factor A